MTTARGDGVAAPFQRPLEALVARAVPPMRAAISTMSSGRCCGPWPTRWRRWRRGRSSITGSPPATSLAAPHPRRAHERQDRPAAAAIEAQTRHDGVDRADGPRAEAHHRVPAARLRVCRVPAGRRALWPAAGRCARPGGRGLGAPAGSTSAARSLPANRSTRPSCSSAIPSRGPRPRRACAASRRPRHADRIGSRRSQSTGAPAPIAGDVEAAAPGRHDRSRGAADGVPGRFGRGAGCGPGPRAWRRSSASSTG